MDGVNALRQFPLRSDLNATIRLQVSDWSLREAASELEVHFSDYEPFQEPRSIRVQGAQMCDPGTRSLQSQQPQLQGKRQLQENTDRNAWIFSKTEVKAKSKSEGTSDVIFFSQGIAKNVTACFFTLPTLSSRGLEEFFWFLFFFLKNWDFFPHKHYVFMENI